MVILNPNKDGCEVWLIQSPILQYESKVTHLKGDIETICKSLVKRLAEYVKTKDQWGNYTYKLCWLDSIFLDVAAIGMTYKYVLEDYGLDVIDIHGKNADSIIPERAI